MHLHLDARAEPDSNLNTLAIAETTGGYWQHNQYDLEMLAFRTSVSRHA
jgi:hypothetical protein